MSRVNWAGPDYIIMKINVPICFNNFDLWNYK